MPPKRMTANPIAPLRYRPGKAVGGEQSSSSESDSESESEQQAAPKASRPSASSFPKLGTNFDLEARRSAAAAARAQATEAARQAEEGFETASDSDASSDNGADETGDEDEEASSDDESSDDDAQPARRFTAPTFVSKSQRKSASATNGAGATAAAAAAQTPDFLAAAADARRREKADELLQAQLDRDAAARIAAQRAWDDDDAAVLDEVDDTDDVDPAGEHAAWKLRELRRVKREREAIEVVEKEREEVERRRGLSEAEREAEDKAFIARQTEERAAAHQGEVGFMQKYFHKGAFFQGEGGEAEEAAKRRDLMGAKYADDGGNRELLPQYMQIRDMTKLGKKGRTKYRDMKSEDTGRWGDFGGDRRGGGRGDGDGGRGGRDGATGANSFAVGDRRPRDEDRGDSRAGERDEKRARFDR